MKPHPTQETLGEGRFLRLLRRDGWEWVERTGSRGVVAIMALTPAGRLLLIEQHRPPLGVEVIELPAGLVGDLPDNRDEAFEDAAGRELLEETGYAAGWIRCRTQGPISAGMSSEVIHFVEARELRKVGPGGGDETEQIEVHEVDLDCAGAWCEEKIRAGAMVDPKVFAALYFLLRRGPLLTADGPGAD